jgi:hypothetical protein
MAGQWLTQMLANQDSLGTASVTKTYDLPKSNFIGSIGMRIAMTGTTPTATLAKVEVVGNGVATILSVSGANLQKIMQLESGNAPSGADGAAAATYKINFGRERVYRDTDFILPAKLFKTLQLRLEWTFGGTVTASALDIWTDEYVSNDDAYSKWINKLIEQHSFTCSASGYDTKDLSLGALLRKMYIAAAGTDGTTCSAVEVRVNNGAEIPFYNRWLCVQEDNLAECDINASAVVANMILVDFNKSNDFSKSLNTAAFNDLKIKLYVGSAQVVKIITKEAVSIPKPAA